MTQITSDYLAEASSAVTGLFPGVGVVWRPHGYGDLDAHDSSLLAVPISGVANFRGLGAAQFTV